MIDRLRPIGMYVVIGQAKQKKTNVIKGGQDRYAQIGRGLAF